MGDFAVLASPGLGWETDETTGRRPLLCQAWSIDPATGKPVARWVSTATPRTVTTAPAAAPPANRPARRAFRKAEAETVLA